ncbi:MAG: PEGA domain-containing protein [Candidatus Korarchaeota archaeon]|nr:PEGA domain-containing protein [Candidatus Korarchaeota archaeon]
MRLILVALSILIFTIPIAVRAEPPTVVFRGHVGAVDRDFFIIWVEDVVQGSIEESGVIEVEVNGGTCLGHPQVDRVEVGDFVEVRGYLTEDCCRKVVVLECSDHYLRVIRDVLVAKVKLLQGCGSSVRIGENITVFFFVSRDANVTLTLEKPNGTTIVFSGFLRAGLYSITGEVGEPEGERKFCILAESEGDVAFYCCDFVAIAGTTTEKISEYQNLTIKVLTEAGYPIRNASVYIDGKLYGFTDRKGMLETNISEGIHEIMVESEYYKTVVLKASPGLVTVKMAIKSPDIRMSFKPAEIEGSGTVKLIVERVGGADLAVRIKLLTFDGLEVNTTEVIGIPPFNATLHVEGPGKLVAIYGNVTAILISEAPSTTTSAPVETSKTTSITRTVVKTSTTTQVVRTTPKSTNVPTGGVNWPPLLLGTILCLILTILILRESLKGRSGEFKGEKGTGAGGDADPNKEKG